MDGFRLGLLGGAQDVGYVEIAVGGPARADADLFVRQDGMEAVSIALGIDRHRL